MAQARKPQGEIRERAGLARIGYTRVPPEGLSWEQERWRTYRDELSNLVVMAVGLLGLGLLASWPGGRRHLPWSLLLLALVDLLMLARLRTVESMPLQPLVKASPVLARLSGLPRGTRSLDGVRNLPMAVGLAPISAYRTLNLPRPRAPELLARNGAIDPFTLAGVVVHDPFERDAPGEPIEDPELMSWLNGKAWVAGEGARHTTFRVQERDGPAPRTWLLPERVEPTAGEDPSAVRLLLPRATPLTLDMPDPQHLRTVVESRGTEVVVVAVQFDSNWSATWEGEGPDGWRPAMRVPVWGGWLAARAPGPGRHVLQLEYRPPEVRVGLIVSAIAWVGWLAGWGRSALRERRERHASS
jgi:hypothetical protein